MLDLPVETTGRMRGVLLVNLGTPSAPSPAAVRRYLAEFLSDPRVVEIPRPLWWLILHLIVLRVRPRRSSQAYRKIWQKDGSPLLVMTECIAERLQKELDALSETPSQVEIGMRYGSPSIGEGLNRLRASDAQRIVIVPLYPQYASATSGSVFDAVSKVVGTWRHIPGLDFVSDYHSHPDYIDAMAEHVSAYWEKHGRPDRLLLSFHGLPERSRQRGDPYFDQCQATARLLAERLGLPERFYSVAFQSRFGRAQWLKPYCVDVLQQLPEQGIRRVDVFCPGFPVDCLETLEELAITNKAIFLDAGGRQFRYIPALNANALHIKALSQLVLEHRP